jgi:hypothetical protein
MLNIISKIFKKKQLTQQEELIVRLYEMIQQTDNHLIALARLAFVKPDALHRESQNIKENGEYLIKLLEAKNKKK